MTAVFLTGLLAASLVLKGVEGGLLRPLEPAAAANVLIFTATDCPVSNGYAPEIQRVCAAYSARGVRCLLIYEHVDATPAAVRAHLAEYRYAGLPAAIDADGAVAARVGATVTPEVAVVDHAGAVRYHGRIDNRYEAIGRERRVVTVHDLAGALDAVLARRAVDTPATPAVGCYIVSPEMRRKSK
jgi:thiol-disulfide isomerase/thioredoxin